MKPLEVFALVVYQNGVSREKLKLDKAQKADRLASDAIYGLLELDPKVVVRRDKLDKLLSHVPQENVPQVLHDPPTCKPKNSKSGGSSGSIHHTTPSEKDPDDSQAGQSHDLLALLVPTADPDAHDDGKHSRHQTEEQLQIIDAVTSAAQDMLKKNPLAVLRHLLGLLKKKGNQTLALTMSPYLLAICSGGQQKLQHALSAVDIEKFASCKGVEKSPQYATHAADGSMDPVIPMAEIGYATEQASKAWKILATLRRKQEAMSGRTDSGKASKQFGPPTNTKGLSVNKSVVNGVEDPSRLLEEVETAELAYRQCMAELVDTLKLVYNSTGYDERALFKIQLIAKANLPEGHQEAAKAVWEAAKQILDDSEDIPAFLPAFHFVVQLLKVLWDELRANSHHELLMVCAEKAKVNRMSGKLNQAFKVCFIGKIEQVCKLAASIAFVSFSRANLGTLFCQLNLVSTGEHDLTYRYSWDLCCVMSSALHSQIRMPYSCIEAVIPHMHIMHTRQPAVLQALVSSCKAIILPVLSNVCLVVKM